QFPLYHKLGVSIYEAQLRWDEVAPKRPAHPTNPHDPAYHWPSDIGPAISRARRLHIRVLLQVITAPPWANGGHHESGWAPRHPAAYAQFVTAAARRYPSVHLWQVWGEPNGPTTFKPIVKARPGTKLNRAQR